MPSELKYPYVLGRRVGKERRTSPRYPFTATCEATEPKSHAKIIGRTSDLGRGGCYIDTIGPFPSGTSLVVRINRENHSLTIEGKVVFAQPGMGMGLSFTKAEPDQQALLDRWISELSGEPAAATPAGSPAGSAVEQRDSAKRNVEGQPMYVINELILLLLQKGVLSESEGKSLLQKLLK
jgi:hypothetical protein